MVIPSIVYIKIQSIKDKNVNYQKTVQFVFCTSFCIYVFFLF